MSEKVYLKPGTLSSAAQLRTKQRVLIVRDPITGRVLPEDGEYKPLTTYWLRRLRCGDVVKAKPQAKVPAADPKKGGAK